MKDLADHGSLSSRWSSTDVWRKGDVRLVILRSSASESSAYLLQGPSANLLVDCGDGALSALLDQGVSPLGLHAILFTHDHADHAGGLYSLLSWMRVSGRLDPLRVIVPLGARRLDDLLDLFVRHARERLKFGLNVQRVIPPREIREERFLSRAAPVIHGGVNESGRVSPIACCAWRVELDGASVVFSGDTGSCASVRELSCGADLALIESTWGESPVRDLPAPGAKRESLLRIHSTVDQARWMGEWAAGTRFIHIPRRGGGAED